MAIKTFTVCVHLKHGLQHVATHVATVRADRQCRLVFDIIRVAKINGEIETHGDVLDKVCSFVKQAQYNGTLVQQ